MSADQIRKIISIMEEIEGEAEPDVIPKVKRVRNMLKKSPEFMTAMGRDADYAFRYGGRIKNGYSIKFDLGGDDDDDNTRFYDRLVKIAQNVLRDVKNVEVKVVRTKSPRSGYQINGVVRIFPD